MKVLLVTPIEEGSGETVTAIHMGEDLLREGNEVRFLASGFARKFIEGRLPASSVELGRDGAQNLNLWSETITSYSPDAVVFADYPSLFITTGVVPLGREPGWAEALQQFRGTKITLDHFGFAQREMGLFFGPPHLTTFHYQHFDSIPAGMEILLPCPMHEPEPLAGRRGIPFRYWDVPLALPADIGTTIRRRYLSNCDGFFIFHLVSNWAWQVADILQVALYRHLPKLLDRYLGGLPKPVTIVSVNNGRLLDPADAPRLNIINLPLVSMSEFEAHLLSADLVVTENRTSIAMGKAVCGLQNCAAFINRQRISDLVCSTDTVVKQVVSEMERQHFASVYPFEVYPVGMADLLEQVILYQNNSLTEAFCDIEVFGGEASAQEFHRLLLDEDFKADLRRKQEHYVRNLARLPRASEAISRFVANRQATA